MRARSARLRPTFTCTTLLCLGAIVASGNTRAVQSRLQGATPTDVRVLLNAGRYGDAETAARTLVNALSAEAGRDLLTTADAMDLLVEALLRNGRGAETATRPFAESALHTKEARLGREDAALVPSLRGLAGVLAADGDLGSAVPLFERALAISERALGPEAAGTVEALKDLAAAQILNNRGHEAIQFLERARAIEEARQASRFELARTLELTGQVLQKKGEYRASKALLERALVLRESAVPGHPDVIGTLNLLGDERWFDGDYRAAGELYARAVAVAERALRPEHPQLALSLKNLANAKVGVGDFSDARLLFMRALAIAERCYGPMHPDLADYVNDLANSNLLQEDYVGARALYERALKIVGDRRGPNNLLAATYQYNLAVSDANLGDFLEARRELNRAVGIWRRELGPEHPYVARALPAVARVMVEQGLYADARVLLERALVLQERALGPDHPDVAETLADLANTQRRLGRVAEAERLADRAVLIWERSGSSRPLRFADLLAFYADLKASQGNFEMAREYYQRALAMRTRVLGTSDPSVADAQAGLAKALAGIGDRPLALSLALQAEEGGRAHLRLTVRSLPERQSQRYATVRPKGLDLALSLSAIDPSDSARVFDSLVRGRALVLDEMAARQHLTAESDRADLSPLWAALASARQRLANLVVHGPDDEHPERFAPAVDAARRNKEEAERALAEKSAAFRGELARDEVGLDDVRAALPSNSALVAFSRYERTLIPASAAAESGQVAIPQASGSPRTVTSYIAFVLVTGRPEVAVIPLGSAKLIDGLLARWRREATGIVGLAPAIDAERSYRVAGGVLRGRIWDPVVQRLNGAGTVFVVPDGVLNLVSLAALPIGPTDYVIEHGPVIHYLSAERDLVPAEPSASMGRGLLAIGGAAFDDAGSFTRTVRPTAAAGATGRVGVTGATGTPAASLRAVEIDRLGAGCRSFEALQFIPLTGTRKEAREIASLWTDSQVEILENRDASERAFKRSAPGHRVLHVATHGFFLGNCATGGAGTRSVGGLSAKRKGGPSLTLGESPLLLSGLAFAGANRRAAAGPADEDGILTAEEVTALNLDGVEWAVLSACDTGLGEITAGEGVFGLRRAFQVAGVRTVIMSLWAVDDQAARLWMRALYEGRLQKHLNTAAAMREASLTMLHNRRAHGQSTHPFFWGAFVAVGDWR